MSRSTEEWIGENDDSAIPARVKVRIFEKHDGKCACCLRVIAGRLRAAYDHILALINGGANRESNIQLLCIECHAGKTKTDVAEKSKNYHVRAKHIGAFAPKQKIQSRGFPATRPQRTATRPVERRT